MARMVTGGGGVGEDFHPLSMRAVVVWSGGIPRLLPVRRCGLVFQIERALAL